MFGRILVANDGSATAEKGLRVALEYALEHGAKVTSLCVEEGISHYLQNNDETKDEVRTHFEGVQERAGTVAKGLGASLECLTEQGRNAARVIIATAKVGCFDLIVLGAKGRSPLQFLVGSTTDRVDDFAPCSVLIVR